MKNRRNKIKYCPKCLAEYRDDVEFCDDCELKLINKEEYLELKKSEEEFFKEIKDFTKVFTVSNQFEADQIKNALEKENIPLIIKSHKDTAYNGMYLPQLGWASVLVPKKYSKIAEDIIKEVESFFSK